MMKNKAPSLLDHSCFKCYGIFLDPFEFTEQREKLFGRISGAIEHETTKELFEKKLSNEVKKKFLPELVKFFNIRIGRK